MTISVVIRGSTVKVTANFFDAAGVAVNPSSATLWLEFPLPDGTRGDNSPGAALVQSGNDWTYEWDSAGAGPGDVYGHVETDDSPPVSSEDFKFKLTANAANVVAHP